MRPKDPHIEAELQSLQADILRETDTDILQVPEGYFEVLEAKLVELAVPKQPKTKYLQLRRISIAAAAIVVVVSGLLIFQKNQAEQPLHIALAEMSDRELDAWYNEQLNDISYADLYAYLEVDINGIETQDLFTTEFADSSSIAAQLYSQIDEQVQAGTEDDAKILDDHYIETVGEEAIQEYLNESFILEDIGL